MAKHSGPSLIDPEDEAMGAEPERLLAAIIYLMSCYARDGGCPKLACVVNRHLELLSRCPGAGAFVRDTCRRLCPAWRALEAARERDAPPLSAPGMLREIVH